MLHNVTHEFIFYYLWVQFHYVPYTQNTEQPAAKKTTFSNDEFLADFMVIRAAAHKTLLTVFTRQTMYKYLSYPVDNCDNGRPLVVHVVSVI